MREGGGGGGGGGVKGGRLPPLLSSTWSTSFKKHDTQRQCESLLALQKAS